MRIEKVHADDCEHCDEDDTGWLEQVRAEIFVEGRFTDTERERLTQIATRCPVHKTLDHGVVFDETITVG